MGQGSRGKLNLQFSVGGAVYRKNKGSTLWLVVRSKPSKEFPSDARRLPKGWIDDEEGGRPGPVARGERSATEQELKEAALRDVGGKGGVGAKIVETGKIDIIA